MALCWFKLWYYFQHARGKQDKEYTVVLSLSRSFPLRLLSLQCLELTCSMAALACLIHNRTWRWPPGWLIRECTVYKPQDHCPLQWSGTTQKANWCQVATGRRWIKLVIVLGLQYSPSKATNKTKVESMSAEWLVQGTTQRRCLFVLVSAKPFIDCQVSNLQ